MAINIEEIYQRQLKPLRAEDRLRLIAMLARDLAEAEPQPGAGEQSATHSVLELEGLGAEIWEGVDAQKYVDELRREWDHRP
jgi:hypothetical protein